jgi:hypothetical protein
MKLEEYLHRAVTVVVVVRGRAGRNDSGSRKGQGKNEHRELHGKERLFEPQKKSDWNSNESEYDVAVVKSKGWNGLLSGPAPWDCGFWSSSLDGFGRWDETFCRYKIDIRRHRPPSSDLVRWLWIINNEVYLFWVSLFSPLGN